MATPEHDIDESSQTYQGVENTYPLVKKNPKQLNHTCSTSVPVTPKIILTSQNQRPVSATTDERNRNQSLGTDKKTTTDKLERQCTMSSGDSLHAYMDPYSICNSPQLNELDICDDIMELDDEIEVSENPVCLFRKDSINKSGRVLKEGNAIRRKSSSMLFHVLDPLRKREERRRANYQRRKSDCNIILNGELVAVGNRRNSATIKISNPAISYDEALF